VIVFFFVCVCVYVCVVCDCVFVCVQIYAQEITLLCMHSIL
jgi:hypothetical protein